MIADFDDRYIQSKRILLGLSGRIAAYKSAEPTRLLTQASAEVLVVMTEAACRFITPVTMQALSGNPVHTDLWNARVPNNMAHIELSRPSHHRRGAGKRTPA